MPINTWCLLLAMGETTEGRATVDAQERVPKEPRVGKKRER